MTESDFPRLMRVLDLIRATNETKDAYNRHIAGAHVSLRALDSLNVLAPEIKSEILSALAARSYAEAETYTLQLRFDATVKILRRRLRQWRDRAHEGEDLLQEGVDLVRDLLGKSSDVRI